MASPVVLPALRQWSEEFHALFQKRMGRYARGIICERAILEYPKYIIAMFYFLPELFYNFSAKILPRTPARRKTNRRSPKREKRRRRRRRTEARTKRFVEI